MKWFTDPDRVKVQWRLIYLNLSAAVLNIIVTFTVWRWMSIATVFSAGFSLWVSYRLWAKIPQIKKEQEEKIMNILRGKYHGHTGGFGIDN